MILLDTSAIYAMADADDRGHGRASSLLDEVARTREVLLVHTYILIEATALLQRRLGLVVAIRFLQEAANLQVHWVTSQDHENAVQLLVERGRRNLSLVDCTSFVVMRRYGVEEAFAFDADFEREGFRLYGS